MAEFTPGPWLAEYDDVAESFVIWMGPTVDPSKRGCYSPVHCVETYRDVEEDDPDFQTKEANTMLMGAAPDLLSALENLLRETENGTQLCAAKFAFKAIDAVRKAKGETP